MSLVRAQESIFAIFAFLWKHLGQPTLRVNGVLYLPVLRKELLEPEGGLGKGYVPTLTQDRLSRGKEPPWGCRWWPAPRTNKCRPTPLTSNPRETSLTSRLWAESSLDSPLLELKRKSSPRTLLLIGGLKHRLQSTCSIVAEPQATSSGLAAWTATGSLQESGCLRYGTLTCVLTARLPISRPPLTRAKRLCCPDNKFLEPD